MDMAIEPLAYMRYFLALGFVLLLIWGGAWIMRRGMNIRVRSKFTSQEAIQIEEVKSIDGRYKLVRLRYHEEEFLLLLGQNHALRLSPIGETESLSVMNDNPMARPPMGMQ